MALPWASNPLVLISSSCGLTTKDRLMTGNIDVGSNTSGRRYAKL